MTYHPFKTAYLIMALAIALPDSAAAQDQSSGQPQRPPETDTVFDGTYATIGIGASYSPSYDGSDDYALSVLPLVTGAVDGIEITPRGPGFAVDFLRDEQGAETDFALGIVATANFDRNRQIKDDVVALLGKRDLAVEVGVTSGVSFNRQLNPFDSLGLSLDVKKDVAGAHEGWIISPSISYFTPLSLGAFAQLSLSADHVDNRYNDYYYTVDNAGSTASGLPAFEAKGGWKSASATLLTGLDLDGDARNGGFGLFAITSYSRLLGDAKRSPVTSIRGDADQFFGALGVGYTF